MRTVFADLIVLIER